MSRAVKQVWLLCSALVVALLLAGTAAADEYIVDFHSDIDVAVDGSMEVVETIRVRAEGVQIRRGIYRDFPTRYRDRLGNNYNVRFDVVGVTRDGLPEPYETQRLSNGMRVVIGTEFLAVPREYEYAIRYRTDRQLGFFADHDELYWNVTGNGWVFEINAASATVKLPGSVNANQLKMEGYTGPAGSKSRDVSASVAASRASIRTTRDLPAQSGLTLVLSWPKGIVQEPTQLQRAEDTLRDNRGVLIALLALVAVAVFLGRAWHAVGRDPKPGVIFPHYDPPAGLSPAASRYVMRMGYDDKALTAAVIDLAVKGYLRINQQGRHYVLERQTSTQPLTDDETQLLGALMGHRAVLEMDKRNHSTIRDGMAAHVHALQRAAGGGRYWANNGKYLFTSLVGTGLVFVAVLLMQALVPVAVLVFVVILLVHAAFGYLLRAPTLEGRKLMDQIEGFKLYLEVAEKDELNLRNPPELTPELFERYLPYAMALGVENEWSERFARALAVMQQQPDSPYRYYHPIWYAGNFNAARMSDFTHSVGSSFNSAISSASVPPGSHSGAGGGGFSGGGGGGGGGGGH